MITVDKAIEEIVSAQPTKWFSKKEIVTAIKAKYPGKWKESGINTQIYACCINKAAAKKQFPSSPKILFCRDNLYQLFNPNLHIEPNTQNTNQEISNGGIIDSASITLEKDLEEYLARNLGQLEKGLTLYSQNELKGRQFNTDAGRIDILAIDNSGNLVVLELKAGIATIQALGQVLSYMGYISHNIAKGKEVRGFIIADDFDGKLKYAASVTPAISLKKYVVSFGFEDVK